MSNIKFYGSMFVVGTALFCVSGFSMWEAYKMGVDEGIKLAREERPKDPNPAPTQYETDNMCIDWLMESNLKEAKKRICGK